MTVPVAALGAAEGEKDGSPSHSLPPEPVSAGATTPLSGKERDIAVGLLLDSAPAPEAIDQGLVIAEALRRCYGPDANGRFPSREDTARRARTEILDKMSLSEEEIRAMAVTLGYSLEPAACGNTCENVRTLAVIELEKQRLLALVSAPPGSCAKGILPLQGASVSTPGPSAPSGASSH